MAGGKEESGLEAVKKVKESEEKKDTEEGAQKEGVMHTGRERVVERRRMGRR